jgi:hypothetical protein
VEIGNGPYGRRRCVPITGGTVKGKYLTGEVVPGGADFMYVFQVFLKTFPLSNPPDSLYLGAN